MLDNEFREELAGLGIPFKFNGLLFAILAVSGVLSLTPLIFVGGDPFPRLLLGLAILSLPPSLLYFLLDYMRDSKQNAIEEALPEALFRIASFPPGTPLEKIIEGIAAMDSPLGREFQKADRMAKAGIPTDASLVSIAENNSSPLLKSGISMILETYEIGAPTSALETIASDLLEMQSVRKEATSALSLQKYTLLGACGILIPVILSLLLGTVFSLGFTLDDSIFGDAQGNAGLLAAAIGAIQIYLFLLCAIAGVFIALQEGKLKKAPVYFCMLFPGALLIFHVLRGMPFL
ncbi:MAG: hypothetical protein ABH863_01180 [Candidatus Micrarchaeota archaeon]